MIHIGDISSHKGYLIHINVSTDGNKYVKNEYTKYLL